MTFGISSFSICPITSEASVFTLSASQKVREDILAALHNLELQLSESVPTENSGLFLARKEMFDLPRQAFRDRACLLSSGNYACSATEDKQLIERFALSEAQHLLVRVIFQIKSLAALSSLFSTRLRISSSNSRATSFLFK